MLEKLRTTKLSPLKKVKRKVGYGTTTQEPAEETRLQLKRMRIQESGENEGVDASSQSKEIQVERSEPMHME